MAISILLIPAMSAEFKRPFFRERRTILWDRMLFEASPIEKDKCLKSWIRSGITAVLQAEMINQFMAKKVSMAQQKIQH